MQPVKPLLALNLRHFCLDCLDRNGDRDAWTLATAGSQAALQRADQVGRGRGTAVRHQARRGSGGCRQHCRVPAPSPRGGGLQSVPAVRSRPRPRDQSAGLARATCRPGRGGVSFLLDTNVVSEIRKKTPHPGVAAWFASAPADELFLSVLVAGEIRLKRRSSNSGSADWLTPMATALFRSPSVWPRSGGALMSLTPCRSLTA